MFVAGLYFSLQQLSLGSIGWDGSQVEGVVGWRGACEL
jgi:hypothetical protein